MNTKFIAARNEYAEWLVKHNVDVYLGEITAKQVAEFGERMSSWAYKYAIEEMEEVVGKLEDALKLAESFNSEALNGISRGFIGNGESDIRISQNHIRNGLSELEKWRNLK